MNNNVPDILSMDMKKVDKANFQGVKQQHKSKSDSKKENSPYKHRNPNKKQKYSPSKNIDPSQITSILKGRKEELAEPLTKKQKVTFDENLNLEHTLTNSEVSLASNENTKKTYPVINSPKKQENKINSPSKQLPYMSPEKSEKRHSPKKSPTKSRTADPEIAILAKHPYTPINELSFLRNDTEENTKFCGIDINMNTDEFYKRIFSLSENKNDISKYSSITLDEWLQKGSELLAQKDEITKQIMAARIRSSYANKVITDQINARAKPYSFGKKRYKSKIKTLLCK